jgi:leucyl aminopeptidase
MAVKVLTSRSVPSAADVVAVPVPASGAVPKQLGLDREALKKHGFEGAVGSTLMIPGRALLAIGIGEARSFDATAARTVGAALARATSRFEHVATTVVDATSRDARPLAQAVTEGFVMAGYSYTRLKSSAKERSATLTLVTSAARGRASDAGVKAGLVLAEAVGLARDLANTPPAYLPARVLAERAVEVAKASGLQVEVFDKDKLEVMGCGGLLGVNRGSVEPPRMVRLTYNPRGATGHLVMVGKGITYDSGGISLKPSDAMHANMKMDMTGAASVLAAMSTLKALGCRTKVTGYLMCTDNRPSGSSVAMGDVLTFRNGKTAEIHNTDAEGRLVLADGLSLAVEQKPDAIVDIATLTGACMAALGSRIAGVLGSHQGFVEQVKQASAKTDEPVWQLPLERSYRKLLDSNVADFRNIGGPYGGAITAALFLNEFTGDVPWAHLDIAGPMNSDSEDGWLTRGATGFGARLLATLALDFKRPSAKR